MFKRISDRLTRAVEWRVDERLDERLDQRLDQRLEDLLSEQRLEIDKLRRELGRVRDRFTADYGHMRTEFDRVAPQVAALEYRFESLRRQLSMPEPDSAEAQTHAELEHERARLRLELVSHYEERLRRLEEPSP
jgi:predicted  nucleic acid-binding Zn-ribbon protein